MKKHFEEHRGWTKESIGSADDILSAMLLSLKLACKFFPQNCLSHIMALKMLSVYMGWSWANDTVIVKHVWVELGQWAAATGAAEKGKDGKEDGADEYARRLIELLGGVLYHCPLEHIPKTQHVLTMILALYKNQCKWFSFFLSLSLFLLILFPCVPSFFYRFLSLSLSSTLSVISLHFIR